MTSFPRADSIKRGEPQSNFAALGELDQQWPDNQDQRLHGDATVTEGHRGDVVSTTVLPAAFPIKRESSGLKCEESTQLVSAEGGHNVVDRQTSQLSRRNLSSLEFQDQNGLDWMAYGQLKLEFLTVPESGEPKMKGLADLVSSEVPVLNS